MCSHVVWISMHIIGFTLTLLSSSSLAYIHNHGVSNYSLLADASLCLQQSIWEIL